ncbi:MAG: ClbS/DfsB family four-helix bundle protein [Chloroflexi bacterium]|nr:ClbS/DfsB family four-helix bundle protein [Chloroflexota bacterium]
MNKKEITQALNEERSKFLKSIEGLSDEQMTEKGVIDEWSIKDMLAHIATWESEMVTFIAQMKQGKKPRTNLMSGKVEELNAEFYKSNKNRPLDRILADFHGVRKQTIKQVESLSEKELTDPKHSPHTKGNALWEIIEGDSFGHEAEHREQIGKWRKKKVNSG